MSGNTFITVVRTEQETQDSCTVTQTSRFEVDGSASTSTSTGTGRLQFHFFAGCAFTDCEIEVESCFSRLYRRAGNGGADLRACLAAQAGTPAPPNARGWLLL